MYDQCPNKNLNLIYIGREYKEWMGKNQLSLPHFLSRAHWNRFIFLIISNTDQNSHKYFANHKINSEFEILILKAILKLQL